MPTRSSTARPLRIGGVPEHFNLPWKLALEDGAFARAGVPVRFEEYPGGTGAMAEALGEKRLDAALMLTEGAVLDIFRGAENRLVKVFVSSSLTWGIHVAADSNIRRVAQIEGRRVAISRHGSGSHLIAVVDALQRGFDVQGMAFEVVGNLDGARAALAGGRAEVFLWERHMTQPLVDAGEFRRVGERIVPWPAFVVSARRSVIRQRGHELRTALDVATDWARRFRRRRSAVPELYRRYGIDAVDARRWLGEVRWAGSWRRPAAALRRVVSALQAQGALRDPDAPVPDPWCELPAASASRGAQSTS